MLPNILMSNDQTVAMALGSGTNDAALILKQPNPTQQLRLRRMRVTGPAAAANCIVMICRKALQTTVKTAANAAAVTIVLNGDDTTGFIKGYQIANDDYLLVSTTNTIDTKGVGHGWRLLKISAATETGANDEVSCTVVGQDGITGVESPVVAGAVAFVLRQSHFLKFLVGNATIEKEDVAAGDPGCPIAFLLDPDTGGAHNANLYAQAY